MFRGSASLRFRFLASRCCSLDPCQLHISNYARHVQGTQPRTRTKKAPTKTTAKDKGSNNLTGVHRQRAQQRNRPQWGQKNIRRRMAAAAHSSRFLSLRPPRPSKCLQSEDPMQACKGFRHIHEEELIGLEHQKPQEIVVEA